MDFLTYKGKPLVRKGNEIYYGDMSEKYIIKFDILSTGKTDKGELPERVAVKLLLSDTQLPDKDRIKKQSEKVGLYEAMDLGAIWLERALKE